VGLDVVGGRDDGKRGAADGPPQDGGDGRPQQVDRLRQDERRVEVAVRARQVQLDRLVRVGVQQHEARDGLTCLISAERAGEHDDATGE
jgi:hypothetical protein